MIEDFAKLIPDSIMHRSGKAFYSGRLAFSSPSDLYILGVNPGGDPEEYPDETVDSHTEWVLGSSPKNWSAYRDESWGTSGAEAGSRGMQPRILHFFRRLNMRPGEVPASNVVFARSSRKATLEGDYTQMASDCWQFHQAVIDSLGVRIVVCLGNDVGSWVRSRLFAHQQVEEFVEDNDRRWTSRLYASSSGLKIAVLTHPSIAAWTNSKTDPTGLVLNALQS